MGASVWEQWCLHPQQSQRAMNPWVLEEPCIQKLAQMSGCGFVSINAKLFQGPCFAWLSLPKTHKGMWHTDGTQPMTHGMHMHTAQYTHRTNTTMTHMPNTPNTITYVKHIAHNTHTLAEYIAHSIPSVPNTHMNNLQNTPPCTLASWFLVAWSMDLEGVAECLNVFLRAPAPLVWTARTAQSPSPGEGEETWSMECRWHSHDQLQAPESATPWRSAVLHIDSYLAGL